MMDNRARSNSIVMVIALGLVMAPILWVVLPPIFSVIDAVPTGNMGAGAEAIMTIIPIATVLILFGYVAKVIMD